MKVLERAGLIARGRKAQWRPCRICQVTVTFAEEGGKTRLDMQMLFPSAKAREFTVRKHGAVEGLNQTLGRLEEHLAKGNRK